MRLFKHYIPYPVLLLGCVDLLVLLIAAEAGWQLRLWQIGSLPDPIATRVAALVSFAVAVQCAMIAVGAYVSEALRSPRFAAARLIVALTLGLIFVSFLFFAAPEVTLWRSNAVYALGISWALLMAVRLAFGRVLGSDVFKRRVLVLGAGARAARIDELATRPGSGFVVVGHVAMHEGPQRIAHAVSRDAIESLPDHVVAAKASEVVLALDERRNSLPLTDLLRVKTAGIQVSEISTFLERETGRVDLETVNPSWLIFSDGFSAGRAVSAVGKRLFDLLASALLLLIAAPLILLTAALVKLDSRGPAFFRQRRVGRFGEPFDILKLRSMRTDAEAAGKAVWAAENDPRVTRVGRIIRKLRIDELPQTWSVLKGEMSFVGPRPERPQFVDQLAEMIPFYAERHVIKPGITGWAQINYPYGANLDDARHKLEYDLYYAKNYSPFLDLLILLQTVRVLLWPEQSGAR